MLALGHGHPFPSAFSHFGLLEESEDHGTLHANLCMYTVTQGMRTVKARPPRLRRAASEQPADPVERGGFETGCQGIRHITHEVFISSPRSDRAYPVVLSQPPSSPLGMWVSI